MARLNPSNAQMASVENAELKRRLSDALAALNAIKSGGVDALVVEGTKGVQVFTLKGADQTYRSLVETMNEGAVTINSGGVVLFSNHRFADIVQVPLRKVLGTRFYNYLPNSEHARFRQFLRQIKQSGKRVEVRLKTARGQAIYAHVSGNQLDTEGMTGFCLVVTDISLSKEAELALREMPQHILLAQELERRRVARELHDGVNQILSATKFRIHSIEHQIDPRNTELRTRTVQAKELIERAINEVRTISRNLHPSELDDIGLVAAIRTLLGDFQERTSIKARFTGPVRWKRLSPEVRLTLYRIVQEALTNIERHSEATRVDVILRRPGGVVTLVIRDNGTGFRLSKRGAKKGLGMENMRERASFLGGSLDIKSVLGQGTEITLQIPI